MANAYLVSSDGDRALRDSASSGPPGMCPPMPIPLGRLRAAVQAARAEKELSINDLVMRSGLSRTAVLDLLNGRGRITSGRLDTWWALAWALEIPMGELMSALDNS